ncbi:exodeoxyribonuclease VII large subunit [Accumulibacter sp.]|uniref:exodeoxyribonuclease VII large subunit n=1 Tax=Accumulibacter sp. TaxID=2053492 RepID=UPI0025ED09D8|nr:exodeoxyribonuclease VII large subunit [Accumulibacter sp.]MCM8594205.1 exodeoxyribonuclease VII large subunit [Accumulibacter sp.]MCM8625770.1 exodeoxyribonuclease VII large subunit [Accumulibacter sp.]MDS4048348.1 exodeoxyribonuclease VII large subunit [Accumulibacter sp.]
MADLFTVGAGSLAEAPVLTVSLLNRLARQRLEAVFPLCWVTGEISGLARAASGHVYFSLKDSAAQVRCVMFRSRADLLGWRLENGQHVEARVLVTLYEARGDFQLNVETLRRAGIGNLYEQFLRLKERLEREGLFDAAAKRAVPAFPRRVGVVTSPQAAALRDVLSTLERRAAQVSIVVYPTLVQGDGAGEQIAQAIRRAGQRAECEVLILCRGGGSVEDLWAFNDEAVARAIRACPIPVISGIGHETDFTIADFAADRRAPTPTAAAELAAPERAVLLARVAAGRLALRRQFEQQLISRGQQLDWLAHRLQAPAQYLARRRDGLDGLRLRLRAGLLQTGVSARGRLVDLGQRLLRVRPDPDRFVGVLDGLALRLRGARQQTLLGKSSQVTRLAAGLAHLNPRAVLDRGYCLVFDAQGRIVRESRVLEPRQPIAVFFQRGRADVSVLAVSDDETILGSGASVVTATSGE